MTWITFVYCRIEGIKVMWWWNVEDVTWPLGDTNFIFECWKYLSWVSFAHSWEILSALKDKFVSPSGHVTSNLHRPQWRYYFYLSRVRILVSPRLLTWLANYKRASHSGARPVLLKFHSQNVFEVRRRYSYRWLPRWAAKFSHRYFFRAWRTFRKICRSLRKWCWKIHWGERKCNTKKRPSTT